MTTETRRLRDALGQFATGICLVTCVSRRGEPLALTVNSFAAVSLEPPLVLWSLQFTSDAFDDYVSARHFAINVLSAEQQALSNQYATQGQHVMDSDHYATGEQGVPLVHGALATFECELDASHPGGDHIILVGRVARFSHAAEANPLLYFRGTYRDLK